MPDSSNSAQSIFSVSEFIEYINLTIGRRQISVEGEVSGYHLNQGKWIFFDLKDQESKVGCFAVAYKMEFPLEDGMQVVVHGAPRVYNKSGKFSLMVDRLELKGDGALKRAFELTKATLEKEGLFDIARKRPLPRFPQAVGLIASRESAAYTDFMRIITQRWPGLEIYLYHVAVQGESAVREITAAFQWFNEHAAFHHIEAIALVRGGGSLEDLQAFNAESVARAVFASRIPVVCGVGHERDESLADYVADIRAATPTHAAALIVQDRKEVLDMLAGYAKGITQTMDHELQWRGHRIQTDALTLQSRITTSLTKFRTLVDALQFVATRTLQALAEKKQRCAQRAMTIDQFFAHWREARNLQLSNLEKNLSHLNPASVLKRGYSIVRRKGSVISSRAQVSPGDQLDVRFADGDVRTQVLSPQGKLL